MTSRHIALITLPALVLAGCVTATTTSRTWGDDWYGPADGWERIGRVERIRETVTATQGDPAGGAVAGAVVGGLLGTAMSGGHGPGGLVGAIGGAMVGASASQGGTRDVLYEVMVRFQDGGAEVFAFRGALPFRVGDDVRLTPGGLQRI
jgi:outer membrane lipoprotein SlyB